MRVVRGVAHLARVFFPKSVKLGGFLERTHPKKLEERLKQLVTAKKKWEAGDGFVSAKRGRAKK